MKKILATVLCLGIASGPCFAYCRYDGYRVPPKRIAPPRIERQVPPPPPVPHYYHRRGHHAATAAAATVVGVVGLAAIISAFAD